MGINNLEIETGFLPVVACAGLSKYMGVELGTVTAIGLKRHLKARHMRLMALGSTIGMGLFLGSASAIKIAGPSILICYLLGALVSYIVLRALGEMTVHEPVAGSVSHFAHNYVGTFSGYMVGWGYWSYWAIVGIAEVTAVGIYMGIWYPDVPQWIWALASILIMAAINLATVRFFGEFEFWFSLIKIATIISMIAVGSLVIFFGYTNNGIPIGFSNLWAHGGFFPNGFEGTILALQIVIFAYAGIEVIGLSAGEAENPEKTIPAAINSLAWRVSVFYLGAITVILAIFPWNQVGQQGSPFVVMFERIGLGEAAGIMNFVVITAALSALNTGIFGGARLMYELSLNGCAHKSLSKLSKSFVPRNAVLTIVIVSMGGVLLNYVVPEKALQYVMSGGTMIGMMVWAAILYTQIKFRMNLSQEQIKSLKFKALWWPYSSIFAGCFIALIFYLMGINEDSRIGLIASSGLLLFYWVMYYVFSIRTKRSLSQK